MNFVEQTAIDQQKKQRLSNDHYYDQDWSMQTTSTTSKTNRKVHSQSASGNSSSSSVAPRGRVSRIKPKEENNYTIDESAFRQSKSSQRAQLDDYEECQEFQPSNAAAKLMEDNSSRPHENHFPVIDESKPFVCQQCGLAFAREKALMSHGKVSIN